MTIINKANKKEFSQFSIKIKLVSILVFVFVNNIAATAQLEYEWHSLFDYSPMSIGRSVTTDNSGNVISAGEYYSFFVLNNDTTTSEKSISNYIIKYNNKGEVQWSKSLESDYQFFIISLETDNNDNIYVCGHFTGTLEFPDKDLISKGGLDGFLISYDKEGNYRWARSAGSSSTDFQWLIAYDGIDGIYVIGRNMQPPFYVNEEITLTNRDTYIIKYNTEGEVKWAYNYGAEYSLPGGIYADENGVILTGYAAGKMYMDTTLQSENLKAMLVSFDLKGNFEKAVLYGGTEISDLCGGKAVVKDEEGNIYLPCAFEGKVQIEDTTLTSLGDESDTFIIKLNNKWERVWVREIKSYNSVSSSYSIKYKKGIFFFLLETHGESSINLCDSIINPVYDDDNFVVTLTTTGSLQQVIHAYSPHTVHIMALAISEYENYLNIYFTGIFNKKVFFPGIEYTSNTADTYFLNKYSFELPQDTLQYNDNFLIYPNPSNGFFNIKYKDISIEQINLSIYDINGKHLFYRSYPTSDSNLIENINVSHLSNGLYLLKIHYNGTVIYKKLIISK